MKFRHFNFKLGKDNADKNPSDKVNKVVYITAVCLLIGIVILAAFTTAANRARKPSPSDTTPNVTSNTPQTTPPPQTTTPPDTDVGEQLPLLSLPTEGSLGMKHDPDLQTFSKTMGDYRVHTGIDILCSESSPVYCAADGTVIKTYEDPLMGYCVSVKHAGGLISVYQNLSPTLATGISDGSSVKGGQLIGTVGDSAMLEVAEEAHLHFAVFLDDEELDPLTCLSESAKNKLSSSDTATE